MSCVLCPLGTAHRAPRWTWPATQVILGFFSVFPPSAWFSVRNPLPFVGVYAAALLASACAAHVHSALCAALVALLPAVRGSKLHAVAAVSVHASSVNTEIEEAP